MPELQEQELEEVNAVDVSKLPSISFKDIVRLPNERSIYFALSETGDVLYIGQTESLSRRWLNHGKKEELEAAGCEVIAWMRTDSDLRALETAFVRRLKPTLNAGERTPKIHSGMMLGAVVKCYRVTNEMTLRQIGAEIGISAATLMRLEQGRDPDGATLAKVLTWLFQSENGNAVPRGKSREGK